MPLGSTLDTAFRRMADLTPDKIYKNSHTAAACDIDHIRTNAHQKAMLKIVWPANVRLQSLGSNTLTTIIWRVVNSRSSIQVQSPCDGIRQLGTKTTRFPAFRAASVIAMSSLTVRSHASRTPMSSKVSRRIAMEPPQAKL